jgi:hypothetical protein
MRPKKLVIFLLILFAVFSRQAFAECNADKFSMDQLVKILEKARKDKKVKDIASTSNRYMYDVKFKDCYFYLYELQVDKDGKIPRHTTKVFFIDVNGVLYTELPGLREKYMRYQLERINNPNWK